MDPGLRGGGQWVAPALSPRPECLAAQRVGAEHPRVQEEPPAASPHPSAGQEPRKSLVIPNVPRVQLTRAQSTG